MPSLFVIKIVKLVHGMNKGDKTMFDYTLHHFKCPYCGYEFETTVGSGTNYKYKGDIYSAVESACHNCGKYFLYGYPEKGEDEFIKMPEDLSELEYHSSWMS